MRNVRSVFIAASLTLTALGHPAAAQTDGAQFPGGTIEERLDGLDQKLRILERRGELEKEEAQLKAKEAPVVGAGKDGFFLKSGDGNFRLKVGGLVQADSRLFVGDEEKRLADTFLLRRVRPIVEGTVFQHFDLRIIPDFAEGKATLIDAYIDFHPYPAASLRAGKFKTPFGLERLQSATDIRFVERALPTGLVPNRDIGIQFYGQLWAESASYALSISNGVPDGASGDVDLRDDKDFAARVFVQPFKTLALAPLQGLGLGLAATFGTQEGTLPSYKSGGQQTFFSYKGESKPGAKDEAKAWGERLRLSPQAFYYWGPFGFLGEYVLSSQEVRKETVSVQEGTEVRTSASGTVDNAAWQVATSFVLTGEPGSFKGVAPAWPFVLGKRGWGAFELVARLNRLDVDETAFRKGFADPAKSARRAAAWGGGLNWYLNKNLKLALDYERTEFQGGGKEGDRERENAVLSRFQLFL